MGDGTGSLRVARWRGAFAFRVGIHRTYVGAVERGERNVSLQNMLRIAEALGVAVSELVGEAEERGQSKRGRRR